MGEPPRGLLVGCTSCAWVFRYDGGPCPLCRCTIVAGLEPPPPPVLV